jgi:hypothetical protein
MVLQLQQRHILYIYFTLLLSWQPVFAVLRIDKWTILSYVTGSGHNKFKANKTECSGFLDDQQYAAVTSGQRLTEESSEKWRGIKEQHLCVYVRAHEGVCVFMCVLSVYVLRAYVHVKYPCVGACVFCMCTYRCRILIWSLFWWWGFSYAAGNSNV